MTVYRLPIWHGVGRRIAHECSNPAGNAVIGWGRPVMADAQRQLVLRTFANANGDADRAAKTLGMRPEDVRRELMALLEGPASGDNGKPKRNSASVEAPAKAKSPKRK